MSHPRGVVLCLFPALLCLASPHTRGGAATEFSLGALSQTNALPFFGDDGPVADFFTGAAVSSAGDLNGDGLADVVVAAPLASPGKGTLHERAYVIFGTREGFPQFFVPDSLGESDGFQIQAPVRTAAGDDFRMSVAPAGDINGDRIGDLLIGLPLQNRTGGARSGVAYVIFGRRTATQGPFPAQLLLSELDGTDGFAIHGVAEGDLTGFSVASAGDLNADRFTDIVIGAPGVDLPALLLGDERTDAGRAYVIFGRNTARSGLFPAIVDLAGVDSANAVIIEGATENDELGSAVAPAGDFNGDRIADLLIGAAGAGNDAGAAYVVFGRRGRGGPAFPFSFSVVALDGSNGLRLPGIDPDDRTGQSVAGADLNADKLGDVIVGAPGANLERGECYVIYGSREPFSESINLSSLNGVNGFYLAGTADGNLTGFSVASAGDVNGDKITDLLVGAPTAVNDTGAAYLIFGRREPFPATFFLSSVNEANGITFVGEGPDALGGFSVAGAGDVNGDKLADFMVGSPGVQDETGVGYVIFGPRPEIRIDFAGLTSGRGGPLSSVVIEDGGVIDLGTLGLNQETTASFTINNEGLADLVLSRARLPRGFTLASPLTPLIFPGDQSLLSISITPTRPGTFSSRARLTSNDLDEKQYDFTVTWSVPPEMNAQAPAGPVIDLDALPDLDGDLRTTASDVALMLRAMAEGDDRGDLNGDGRVDGGDLGAVLREVGGAW